jgi:hypothetical protein
MENILNNIALFVFIMSALNMGRHGWKIFLELRKENPEKINYSDKSILFLGFSFSYILTYLISLL